MAWIPSFLTSLLAWWDFTETSGNRLDSHTGGYDLTPVGTVGYSTTAPTDIDNSSYVSGNASNYLYSSASGLKINTSFSVNFWMYSSNWATEYAGLWFDILGHYAYTSPGTGWMIQLRSYGGIRIIATVGSDSRNSLWSTGTGITGSGNGWKMITLLYNSSNYNTQFYINAVYNSGATLYPLYSAANDFRVFRAYSRTTTANIQIAQVSMWKKFLSSTEITALYELGAGVMYPSGNVAKINGIEYSVIAKLNGIVTANLSKINNVEV